MKPISLRSARPFAPAGADVDRDERIIRNVSIISAGPALGHGFVVDRKMLGQVADAINAKPRGVKSRLTHPGIPDCGGWDGVETMLGRVGNARVEGNQVFGDLTIGKYATKTPAGDIGDYVMTLAEEDPEIAGMSIVFEPADEHEERPADKDEPHSVINDEGERVILYARVKDVTACDLVGDPAANAGGLLSRLPLSIKNRLPSGLIGRWAAADKKAVALGAPHVSAPAHVTPAGQRADDDVTVNLNINVAGSASITP